MSKRPSFTSKDVYNTQKKAQAALNKAGDTRVHPTIRIFEDGNVWIEADSHFFSRSPMGTYLLAKPLHILGCGPDLASALLSFENAVRRVSEEKTKRDAARAKREAKVKGQSSAKKASKPLFSTGRRLPDAGHPDRRAGA